ncbi:FAD-binding oxidoreductase [Diaphorobacter ruginosibacter]|uniref:FAD-binding oxidoreductase n=1 Tax=Diaphorobacter ruginosibacter TaxID=1715720 RepID=A0A7G9RPM3_9BURK|nr:FAD-binding oxidoreductase [Diaphorobacter ruginosibacter]QNN57548.1 FAD-binding oxidoreductase [Diaphorobacter ruginosibacter]
MTPNASSEMEADFLIIGAGIAGASLAHWLAPHGKVVMLERESMPGYHSTGRSAALYMESYGTEQVRVLTRASRQFFDHPPEGFSDYPLLTPRGAMTISSQENLPQLQAHWEELCPLGTDVVQLTGEQAREMIPVLREEHVAAAVYEPGAADMDVHAIHQGFLRSMRRTGGVLVCDAEVTGMARDGAGVWQVTAGGRNYSARVVVNAAGAWGDHIASLAGVAPLGLEPCRRSAMVFAPPQGMNATHWPMVNAIDESWYIKPDAGMLLGSPANADPTSAHDVQPEEFDIALAIHRIEEATTLTIRRPDRTWAGLRSFVSDGDLVGGFDAAAPGFFWLVAQGGYGIQTSAAMGETCASLVRGLGVPERIAGFGLTADMLSPGRASLARR